MTITTSVQNNTLCAALEGRIDTITGPQLEQEISEALGHIDTLILDLENVDYVSSAGIRAMLSLHKKMAAKQGHLTLQHLNNSVLSVLKMTKLDSIFCVE